MDKKFNDIYELSAHYYKLANDIPYPALRAKPYGAQFKTHKEWGSAMDEWEAEQVTVRELRKEYNEKQAEINYQFKVSLLEFLEIIGHPKAELLWVMAWDEGHSGGYAEVAQVAERLSNLLT